QTRLVRRQKHFRLRENRRKPSRSYEPRRLPTTRRHGKAMKPALAVTIAALLLLVLAALPSAHPQIPSGREVVAPSTYVSVEPVARNSNFQLAVVLKIRPGFHVNARKPSAEYLIPTDLRPALPAGFKSTGEIAYPQGE